MGTFVSAVVQVPVWALVIAAFVLLCAIGIADNYLIKRYRVVELPEETPAHEDHA